MKVVARSCEGMTLGVCVSVCVFVCVLVSSCYKQSQSNSILTLLLTRCMTPPPILLPSCFSSSSFPHLFVVSCFIYLSSVPLRRAVFLLRLTAQKNLLLSLSLVPSRSAAFSPSYPAHCSNKYDERGYWCLENELRSELL